MVTAVLSSNFSYSYLLFQDIGTAIYKVFEPNQNVQYSSLIVKYTTNYPTEGNNVAFFWTEPLQVGGFT